MRFAKSLDAKIINTFSGPLERIDTFYLLQSLKKLGTLHQWMILQEMQSGIWAS